MIARRCTTFMAQLETVLFQIVHALARKLFYDCLERTRRIRRNPPIAAIANPRPNFIRLPVSEATSPNCRKCLKEFEVLSQNYH